MSDSPTYGTCPRCGQPGVDPPLSRVIALAESEQALGEESYFAEEIGDVIAFLENARLHYAEGGS